MNERLKNLTSKPFKRWDILGFIILSAVIALLFLPFFEEGGEVSSATVYLEGKSVLKIDFDGGACIIKDCNAVEGIDESTFKIVSEKGYNIIEIDWEDRQIKVVDTDCGTTKECTLMSLKDGVIICAPHELTIKADGEIPPPKVG